MRIITTVPEVLFVCVHNAGRSQMAAALLDHYAEGRVGVRSAGSEPADRSTPTSSRRCPSSASTSRRERPKPLTDEAVRAADVVVTMGCGDACPIYPGKRYEDWELDDPAEADLDGVRRDPRRDRRARPPPPRRADQRAFAFFAFLAASSAAAFAAFAAFHLSDSGFGIAGHAAVEVRRAGWRPLMASRIVPVPAVRGCPAREPRISSSWSTSRYSNT